MSGPWAGADVPAMWESAQQADTAIAWRQVTGWQTTYELLDHHQLRLRQCRDELRTAWPPERSPASRAFLEYLDALVLSMDQAKDDALANRAALAGVLTSLSTAKHDMAELKAKWDGYAEEEATFRGSQVELVQLSGGPDWRARLNAEGRVRMERADQEIFESTQQMSIPTPFGLPTYERGIPFSVAPVDIAAAPSGEAAHAGPMPGNGMSALSGRNIGGSMGPSHGAIAGNFDTSNGALPTLAGVVGRDGLSPVDASGSRAAEDVAPTATAPAVVQRKEASTQSDRSDGSAPKRSASGASGSGEAGNGHAERSARRANPVGGVIGSSAERGAMAIPTALSSRPSTDRSESHEPLASYQWVASRGGPPVLEPQPERPHDPGPGVIGIDR